MSDQSVSLSRKTISSIKEGSYWLYSSISSQYSGSVPAINYTFNKYLLNEEMNAELTKRIKFRSTVIFFIGGNAEGGEGRGRSVLPAVLQLLSDRVKIRSPESLNC